MRPAWVKDSLLTRCITARHSLWGMHMVVPRIHAGAEEATMLQNGDSHRLRHPLASGLLLISCGREHEGSPRRPDRRRGIDYVQEWSRPLRRQICPADVVWTLRRTWLVAMTVQTR